MKALTLAADNVAVYLLVE